MITRIIFLASIVFFTSCGTDKKEEVQNDEQKEAETPTPAATTPEGVLIQVQTETDTLKGSPKAYALGKIGKATITIEYHSPAVRGRTIWGGLVAYDNVWVTGAHKATSINFDKDIKIGETVVTAGKYAIFTIPAKDQWTVIINRNWNQHLADDYSEAEDVVRIKVTPEKEETHQERLRYAIESENAGSGEVVMYWDKIEISLPFAVVE